MTDNDSKPKSNRLRLLATAGGCFIFLGVVVALIVYFATRPKDIPVVTSSASESIPTLVAAGTINEFDGVVRIDSTFNLDDPTIINYYLTVQDVESYPSNGFDEAKISLYLTTFASAADLLTDTDDKVIVVANVVSALGEDNEDEEPLFPYRLPDKFMPEKYPVAAFVVEGDDQSGVQAILGTVDFIKQGKDQSGSTMDNNDSGNEDVTAMENGNGNENSPSLEGLTSNLQGTSSYPISGTISLEFRSDFVNGEIQSVPTLRFDNIMPPSAPGPVLYLSPRSLEESRGSSPTTNDLLIPIDEAGDGSFTVSGTFFQDLDEVGDDVSISDFENGSWIVWCDPFSVYLGGGQIRVTEG